MFFSTETFKGHKNSNTLKRHGLRIKNKVSPCSKTLWIIGSIFAIILIAISSTIVYLGHDGMYADKQEKEVLELKLHTHKYKNHPIDRNKKDDIINKFNIDTSTDDNKDTKRMDVNGKEVNIETLDENEENNNKNESDNENTNENKIENKIKKNENDNDDNNEDDSESHSDKTKENDKNDIEHNDEAKKFQSNYKKNSDKITGNTNKDNINSDESEHKLEDNNVEKNNEKRKLDSAELERIIYSEYWDLPTFFDIDKDDIEGLIKYWKESGKTHYNKYITKFRELQDYDLKETIMIQDE
eukprot:151339_1